MIFTLYSYKGGVGRSMALANVAHWLYLRGLTVLMVDWDLEAPGLETFFYRSADKIDLVRSHLGVIDLLTAYCRQFPYLSGPSSWDDLPPVESYLCEIEPEVIYQKSIEKPHGRLRLLSAGWRSGERFAEYGGAVHAFDWASFYTRFRGQEYFDWFRNQLLSLADVVLVDSRTGITEMGGVCTRHLADVVVSFCAPNSQNLKGVLEMAYSFQSDAVTKARGRRLEVLILPARIDDQDSAGYTAFRSDFVRDTEPFTPAVLRKWKRSPWELAIPYKAQYSYGESLATGVEGSNEKVEQVYKLLATHIAFFSPQGSKLWNACLPEMKPLAAAAGIDLSVPPWHEAEAVVAQFTPEELLEAQRALLRLVNLSQQSPSLDSRRRSTRAELDAASSTGVIERLTKSGVIARVEATDAPSSEAFELAQESVVTNWPRLSEWIQAQRPLLLWRQDLAAQAAKWVARDRDIALLLRGTPLREAVANSSKIRLNESERLFVESSLKAEAERERIEQEQIEQARLAEERRRIEGERAERDKRAELEVRRTRIRLTVAFSAMALFVVGLLGWRFLVSRSNSDRQTLIERLLADAHGTRTERALRIAEAAARVGASDSAMVPKLQSTLFDLQPLRAGHVEHDGPVQVVKFSIPQGEEIASAGDDGWARVFRTDGSPSDAWKAPNSGRALAFSQDGYLASGGSDGICRIFDQNTFREIPAKIPTFHGKIGGVLFSPNGKILLISDDRGVSVQAVSRWREITSVHPNGMIQDLAFSDDSVYFATATKDPVAHTWTYKQPSKAVEDLEPSGKLKQGVSRAVNMVVFARGTNPRRLATASADHFARIWTLTTAAPEQTALPMDGEVYAVAFSPDGKLVAGGGADKTARIWSVPDGRELRRLSHNGDVRAIVFSPDGKRLATGSGDGMARIWDVETGMELQRIEFRGEVNSVAFSPDGKFLATGSGDRVAAAWRILTPGESSNLSPIEVRGLACLQADRNFTRIEWEGYFKQEPYRNTCPGITSPAQAP